MQPNKVLNKEQIASDLFDIFCSQMRVDCSFTPQSNLIAAGLDSLAMVRILVAVEEKYGVWMEPADLTPENLANVETMAESLHRLLVNQTPGS